MGYTLTTWILTFHQPEEISSGKVNLMTVIVINVWKDVDLTIDHFVVRMVRLIGMNFTSENVLHKYLHTCL